MQLNPAASQSFISLAALALKAIEVVLSSSLRGPEPFRAPAREAEIDGLSLMEVNWLLTAALSESH